MNRTAVAASLAAALLLAVGSGAVGYKTASANAPRERSNPSQPAKSDAEQHVDEAEHEALPKRVRLSPKVISDAKVMTERVKMQAIAPTLELSGELVADPDRSARVASPVAGQLVRVLFKEGAAVKKGDAFRR